MSRNIVRYKVLVLVLAVLLLLVTSAGCVSNYQCKYSVRLEFTGDVHRPTMYLELHNIGFNPRISSNASGAVDFSPVCNDTQQIEKGDEQKVLGKILSAYAVEHDNQTSKSKYYGNWSILINIKDSGETANQMAIHYKHWTLCVKSILIEKITKDLNMTKKYEGPIGKCNQLPGFTADILIAAAPVVAFVLVRKKR